MKQIYLNQQIKSNRPGYEHLCAIYNEIISSEDKSINLNFKNTYWLDANLSAVLGAIIKIAELNGYNITKSNIQTNTQEILVRNGFLEGVSNKSKNTVISYQEFFKDNNDSFSEYIIKEMFSKENFPKHSEELEKAIGRNIFELFDNASVHGKSNYIHTCGQLFPNNIPPKLDFTIVDMGNTFYHNVNQFKVNRKERRLDPHEAINWAIPKGNTTKVDRTGGLGLGLLLEFLELNKGSIQIVSDKGFWEYKNNKVNAYNKIMNNSFPGAIVNIEFNFDDKNYYSLKSEKNNNNENIF